MLQVCNAIQELLVKVVHWSSLDVHINSSQNCIAIKRGVKGGRGIQWSGSFGPVFLLDGVMGLDDAALRKVHQHGLRGFSREKVVTRQSGPTSQRQGIQVCLKGIALRHNKRQHEIEGRGGVRERDTCDSIRESQEAR